MSNTILDVVGKPEGELALLGEEPYGDTTAAKYECDGHTYWHVVDALGNDVWYRERL